jgi:hypothetical protein
MQETAISGTAVALTLAVMGALVLLVGVLVLWLTGRGEPPRRED